MSQTKPKAKAKTKRKALLRRPKELTREDLMAKRDAELAAADRQAPELDGVPTRAEVAAIVAGLNEDDRKHFSELYVQLARVLGSFAAARAWLYSRDAGFDPTPMSFIEAGRVEIVRRAIESQTGPSPTYA